MLRITDNYTLQTLCGAPHNVGNEEGKITGMAPNRAVYEENSREMLDIILRIRATQPLNSPLASATAISK